MQGANTDRESIGELVWAPAVGNEHVRWPAEALDPLNPPKGRTVPREALAALNQTERLALQHAEQQRARTAIRNSKADAAGAPECAVAAAAETPAATGKAAARSTPVRVATPPKMLVVYFGTARWAWMEPERLLDFDTHELCAAPPPPPPPSTAVTLRLFTPDALPHVRWRTSP